MIRLRREELTVSPENKDVEAVNIKLNQQSVLYGKSFIARDYSDNLFTLIVYIPNVGINYTNFNYNREFLFGIAPAWSDTPNNAQTFSSFHTPIYETNVPVSFMTP